MALVDLIKSEQLADSYRALNPAMLLPALVDEHGPPLWIHAYNWHRPTEA